MKFLSSLLVYLCKQKSVDFTIDDQFTIDFQGVPNEIWDDFSQLDVSFLDFSSLECRVYDVMLCAPSTNKKYGEMITKILLLRYSEFTGYSPNYSNGIFISSYSKKTPKEIEKNFNSFNLFHYLKSIYVLFKFPHVCYSNSNKFPFFINFSPQLFFSSYDQWCVYIKDQVLFKLTEPKKKINLAHFVKNSQLFHYN